MLVGRELCWLAGFTPVRCTLNAITGPRVAHTEATRPHAACHKRLAPVRWAAFATRCRQCCMAAHCTASGCSGARAATARSNWTPAASITRCSCATQGGMAQGAATSPLTHPLLVLSVPPQDSIHFSLVIELPDTNPPRYLHTGEDFAACHLGKRNAQHRSASLRRSPLQPPPTVLPPPPLHLLAAIAIGSIATAFILYALEVLDILPGERSTAAVQCNAALLHPHPTSLSPLRRSCNPAQPCWANRVLPEPEQNPLAISWHAMNSLACPLAPCSRRHCGGHHAADGVHEPRAGSPRHSLGRVPHDCGLLWRVRWPGAERRRSCHRQPDCEDWRERGRWQLHHRCCVSERAGDGPCTGGLHGL